MAVFDQNYYLQNNPDVAAAIASGVFQGSASDHYNIYGQGEGRSGYGAPPAQVGSTAAPVSGGGAAAANPITAEQIAAMVPKIDYSRMDSGFAGVNTGINAVNSNLGTVNSNVGAVGDAVKTGFAGVNTGLGTVNEAVKTGNTANAAGFAGIGTRFDANDAAIKAMGTAQTNYFTTLSDQQKAGAAQIGTLSNNFNDFNEGYDKDVVRADTARNDLSTGMANNFNQVRSTLGSMGGNGNPSATATQNSFMSNVGGGQMPTNTTSTQPQGGFVAAPQAPAQTAPNPFVAQLASIKNVLQTAGSNIDPRTAQDLFNVATAFDDNGALIPGQMNQDGTRTARAMGPDGMLYTALIGADGRPLNSTAVSIDNAFGVARQIGSNRSPYAVA